MVQTDISQLSKECNEWRERLHSRREEFNQLRIQLQHVAGKSLSKEQLTDLEHYQNQLHIQLINIHDLKQAVKAHDKKISLEVASTGGMVTEDTFTDHENLYDNYQSLDQTLSDLCSDFKDFVNSLR